MWYLPNMTNQTRIFWNRIWMVSQLAQRKKLYKCGYVTGTSPFYAAERAIVRFFSYPRVYVGPQCNFLIR